MISERLTLLREELGVSKRELIKALPFNYSTYANYESGIREPNYEVLRTLAAFYKVSIDYIMGLTDKRKRVDDIIPIDADEYEKIHVYRGLDEHGKAMVDYVLNAEQKRLTAEIKAKPVVEPPKFTDLQVFKQRASAGLGNYFEDYSDEDFEILSFFADSVNPKTDFGLRLRGDSMEPKFSDGDVLCVKAVPRLDPEQIGIFIYEGEVYCKRLKIDRRRGEICLESLNWQYKPIIVQQPDLLKTVGVVLGAAKRQQKSG